MGSLNARRKARTSCGTARRGGPQGTWLGRLSQLALDCADETEIAEAAVRAVARALRVDMAQYLELHPADGALALRAAVGLPRGLVGKAGILAHHNGSFYGFVLASERPVAVADLRSDSRFTPSAFVAGLGATSALGTAVRGSSGEVLGVLGAQSRTGRRFSDFETEAMKTIANVLSLAVVRRRSEGRFQAVVQNSSDFIAVVDAKGALSYCNPALRKLFGLGDGDVRGVSTECFVHPDDLARATAAFRRDVSEPGRGPRAVNRFQTASGEWRHLEVVATNCLDDPAVRGVVLNGRDVTETTRLTRVLRTLSAGNHALVSASDETSLLNDVCRAIVEVGGFPLAWAGYAERGTGRNLRPVASAGLSDYLEGLRVSWADDAEGRGPAGTAVRAGEAQVISNLAAEASFGPWREAAHRFGLRSACALPLRVQTEVVGVLSIYAAELDAFGPEEVSLLQELAQDLSYGAARLRDAVSLRASEQRFRALAGSAPIGVVEISATGEIEYANARVAEITGHSTEDLLSGHWIDHVHADNLPETLATLEKARAGEVAVAKFRLRHPGNEDRHVRVSVGPKGGDMANGSVVTVEDVTDETLAQEAIAYQATHDPLTGLANRALFLQSLDEVMSQDTRAGGFAVLLLDLDRFKVVNDSLGHLAGDEVLRQVAERFTRAAREGDVVARFSGDEFMFIMHGVRDSKDPAAVATRLLSLLEAPVSAAGRELWVTASLGIVVPSCQRDATAILRDAEAAMYRAKAMGRNRWALFDDAFHAESVRRLALEADLQRAIERQELEVHYQPLVDPVTGRPKSAEALVRWRSPSRGLVMPSEFVPLAEETGLIGPIGAWVLERAIAQVAAWDQAGGPCLEEVAVNLSARQLDDPATSLTVEDLLTRYGIAPSRLCVEVTESVLMADTLAARQTLEAFRALGLRVAIDDFGTGYSSLAYLHALPVTTVKVDRMFVERLGAEDDSTAVVKAVVEMSHAMGLNVVAEGVSSAGLNVLVAGLGCERAQGFHWARPLPSVEFAAWWRKTSSVPDLGEAAASRNHRGSQESAGV